jgi:hypothetical protein
VGGCATPCNWRGITIIFSFVIQILKRKSMAIQVVTQDDLNEFRLLLLNDLKEIFNTKATPVKKWLKSTEVREMLNISNGTLQSFRIKGILTFTKIGGINYYAHHEIEKLLESKSIKAIPTLFK